MTNSKGFTKLYAIILSTFVMVNVPSTNLVPLPLKFGNFFFNRMGEIHLDWPHS
jgi:hypothetical protein